MDVYHYHKYLKIIWKIVERFFTSSLIKKLFHWKKTFSMYFFCTVTHVLISFNKIYSLKHIFTLRNLLHTRYLKKKHKISTSILNKKCLRNIYALLVQNSKLPLLKCTRNGSPMPCTYTHDGCNPCTKFGIDQLVSKEWFDRDLWTSALKINRDHLFIGRYPYKSLLLIKWRGQKILSGQHTGLRREVWPWPLIMWPENQ